MTIFTVKKSRKDDFKNERLSDTRLVKGTYVRVKPYEIDISRK